MRDAVPILAAAAVVAVVAVREVVRWRGRRWQRRATPGRSRDRLGDRDVGGDDGPG